MAAFQELFETISTQAETTAGQFANIVNMAMPAFQAVFIVYCMFVVWSYWENESSIQGTFIDLMKRVVAWGLILGLGMNLDTYNSVVMRTVLDFGTGLAQGFSGNTEDSSSLDGILTKLIQISETTLDAVGQAGEENVDIATAGETTPVESSSGAFGVVSDVAASAMSAVSDMTVGALESVFGNLTGYIMAYVKLFFLWIFAIPFLGVSIAYMVVAQVMLAFLAAIGPIFFGFALFPATRTYFTNWIGQVLNYGFYFLFIGVTVTLAINIANSQLDGVLNGMAAVASTVGGGAMVGGVVGAASGMALSAGDAILALESLMYLVATFVIFVVVIFQIPSLTSQLFGGLAVGGFAQVARSAATVATAGKSALVQGAAGKALAGAAKLRGTNNIQAENKGK